MRIGIIGAGNLGTAIASGLIEEKRYERLYLTKRNTNALLKYSDHANVCIGNDNREAVSKADVLIFSVQPRHLELVLEEVKDLIDEHHVVISTVTGYSIANIEALIGPYRCIVRAMPNTAISVGKSMTCLSFNDYGDRHGVAVEIFDSLGITLEISEKQMQAATVICASGIAFWLRLIRATTQGAIQLGFETKDASTLAIHTCIGAASLMIESGNHPEQEIDRVTTPRGCTIEGLNEMEHQGLSSALIKGMVVSYEKIDHMTSG